MQSMHSVYACDPFGVRLGDASAFVSLKYARVANDIGTATVVLPGRFKRQLLRAPDGRLEIWRRTANKREVLETETTWLIKKIEDSRDEQGKTVIVVEADTPLCLLKEPGRFVNWTAGSANATVTDALDDAIKFVARTNIGSSAGAGRDLSAYITIGPDNGLAPSDTKSFAWRDPLLVMQEMAYSSAQQGVYLAFDMVAPTPDTLEFRTYVQQRGVDHRFPAGMNPVMIGPEFGNMGACSLTTDWRDEVTYAKAGGRGEGADRLTATAQDNIRIGTSPFGLREKFVSATQYETAVGLDGEAEAAVRQGRPKTIFRGQILDTPDTRYGVHWAWGDYVTVQAFGRLFDARIEAIEVTVEQGKETINAWVRSDL
jgi:hypothetical protein